MMQLFYSGQRHVIKRVMTTHVLTFAGICDIIDGVRNNNVNFHSKCVLFESDKILF